MTLPSRHLTDIYTYIYVPNTTTSSLTLQKTSHLQAVAIILGPAGWFGQGVFTVIISMWLLVGGLHVCLSRRHI